MTARAWLTVSVLGNAALAGICFWLWHRGSPGPIPPSASHANIDGQVRAVATAESIRSGQLDWSASMMQLRRAGVPSAIIARIVMEKVAQKWTPLEAQFERQYLNDEIDAARLGELHDERALEEDAELRAALGAEYRTWHREYIVHNMNLGGLQPTEEQKEPLYVVEMDWRDRLHDLEVAKRKGRLDQAAFDAAFAQAEAEYKSKLAGIIGSERVFGEPADHDPGAPVRREFERLQLTDAQVNELAAVQKKWSDLRRAMGQSLDQTKTMDVAYDGDLQAIDRARDEEYRRILGDEAFTRWQRPVDRYRALRNDAPAWGLDKSQVDRVYELIRSYDLAVATFEHQAQAREQSGQNVDWGAVDQSVALYTQQTEASLRAYLGNERFEKMKSQAMFGLRQPNPVRTDPNARAPGK